MTPIRIVTFLLLAVFLLQLSLWNYTRHIKPRWLNIPPAPSVDMGAGITLGDKQFAYRTYGVTMQGMGDHGGEVSAIRELDFRMLGKWFEVLDNLDPHSSFMPMMVAYYFSATDNPEQLDVVIDYLRKVGLRQAHDGRRWRWLVNAIFLAKHKQKDLDKALSLAKELAALENEGVTLPIWAKNMPGIIQLEQGDKESAYQMVIRILQESVDDMHPNEVNFMVDYLCTRVLDKDEAKVHPLCQGE